jgi:hypothetical protein
MNWKRTDGRYYEALRRLAVVLLVLADIADRADCRCWPIRSLVLWLLSRAAVRVGELAARQGASPLPVGWQVDAAFAQAQNGDSARSGENRNCSDESAARLAATFRALADIFFALARPARQWLRIARLHSAHAFRLALPPARQFFAARPPCADTS